ncbi:MAG: MBL fold metallo-hydrolase [Planctomycetota bacterium]|nr:MAG: MBL fold metallo-hydrolase [Planctomycetota bacterium]
MKATFLGAAGCVTGSMTLVQTANRRVLVDCGIHQGSREQRDLDREHFPFDPATLDAVVLTHAHLDHCGMLPRLVQAGYAGRVTVTAGTRDLCGVILPDSGRLQQEGAEHARRHGSSRHQRPQPLYTQDHAEQTLKRLDGVGFDTEIDLCPGVRVRFLQAAHIVGSASVLLSSDEGSILFSGDMGRDDRPIGPSPDPPAAADAIVLESTYGDRLHERSDPADTLADVISRTTARGGSVLVPAFAVGRTQMLMYLLYQLRREGRIPFLPVWMDSPMAQRATEVYRRHAPLVGVPHELVEDVVRMTSISTTPDESRALDRDKQPKVLVSASGMLEGGRVLHHLLAMGGSPRNTILLSGYQAPGTRGAALADGERYLKLHGKELHVRAEVAALTTLSAHADQGQLLAWLARAEAPPRQVLVNHGQPEPAATLARLVTERLGWPAHAVQAGEQVQIEPRGSA